MRVIDALFGCWHKNISFPQTHKRGQRHSGAAAKTGTYVVCLDCGREFAYDWQRMQIVPAPASGQVVQPQVEIEAKAS